MEVGPSMPPGDAAAVLVDAEASHHMVPAEYRLRQHVANTIDCNASAKELCGLPSVTWKGTLVFVYGMTEASWYRST